MSAGRQHRQYLARAHAMGGSTTVPAADTIPVLVDLASRMSLSAIGRALGTSHNYVARVISGDIKRMQPARRAAILALGDHQPQDSSHVTALGTRRRLQALHALGYSYARLEREIGCYGVRSIKDVVYGRLSVIEAQHAVAVAATYERLSMRLPEATSVSELSGITRARNTAKRLGWAPPLAWDDIDKDCLSNINGDDYQEGVIFDEVAVQRAIDCEDFDYDLNRAERAAVVAGWKRRGRSLTELSRLSGWNVHRYATSPDSDAAA